MLLVCVQPVCTLMCLCSWCVRVWYDICLYPFVHAHGYNMHSVVLRVQYIYLSMWPTAVCTSGACTCVFAYCHQYSIWLIMMLPKPVCYYEDIICVCMCVLACMCAYVCACACIMTLSVCMRHYLCVHAHSCMCACIMTLFVSALQHRLWATLCVLPHTCVECV